ncbi:MAG: tRNA glutamyl-Q(34) synthetase GluQRS [Rhodospirillaceae bacterium]
MKSVETSTVTRFAPSPTGLLHLGHAFSALDAHDAAGSGGGFLLRIEDIDRGRCRREFEEAIFEDLEWLGLSWDMPVRRQSEHFDAYRAALNELRRMGLLYSCFCTRADIRREIESASAAPHPISTGPDGPVYPGTCRTLTDSERKRRVDEGEPYALRLRMAEACTGAGALSWTDTVRGEIQAEPRIFGDVVLGRKDIPTSYHLACAHDDALQGITLVTRGEDLFSSTHVHRLLQALLNLPTPLYRHHRLIMDKSGKKFSKRDHAVTLRSMREAGRSAEDVIGELRKA